MNNKYLLSEKKELVHFNKMADNYDNNYNYHDPFTKYKISKKSKLFVHELKKHTSKTELKILEIGCGTGEYTKHIAKAFPRSKIIGLDISDKIIEVAKTKCFAFKNTSFVTESAYKTSFKNEYFDIICGFYVIHHLKVKKLSSELFRVLKPGGYIYFCEPNILNPIVYLIKSNSYFKKLAGDSPEEWAVNPLKINNEFQKFTTVSVSMGEYFVPFKFLSYNQLVFIDKFLDKLDNIWLLRFIGGSVRFLMKKNGP